MQLNILSKFPYHYARFLIMFFILANFQVIFAQNVLDDIKEEEHTSTSTEFNNEAPKLYPEKIRTISGSRRIFIITNDGRAIFKGDFVSLLVSNKLVCRALVAKTTEDNIAGIKILKIYDVNLWKGLRQGSEVLILKGDDSYYTNPKKADEIKDTEEEDDDTKLKSEEDLFNSTLLDEDITKEENSKRLIKLDNVISAGLGLIPGNSTGTETQQYSHINGSWAYQLTDNIWGEFLLGSHIVKDYPAETIDTRVNNFTGRAKFTFNAPFYSYFMPYLGYQLVTVSSPGAGVDDGSGERKPEQLAQELDDVDALRKNTIIFGVTVLKRLVPGWFVKLDIGTDIISGGLALEF